MIFATTFSDILFWLRSLGRKRSVDEQTPHTASNNALEWLSLPGIPATSEQDLLVALSALLQVPISYVNGVQAVANDQPNTFPPINNLPVEIFIQILKIASEVNTERPAVYLGELSLVCCNWKAIIYSTPSLWTRIVCGDQVRRALENSRQMPLAAQIPTRNAISLSAFRRFLSILAPHSYRLQSFSASDVGYGYEIHEIYPLLKAIHTLHISGEVYRPISRLGLDRSQIPNLLHLALDRFRVPWESDLLSGLESLIILHLTADHSPSLKEFEAVLDRCPSLKVLRVESDGRGDYDTGSPDRLKVQLPWLEELSVKRVPSLVALPAIIEAPRLLELDITTNVNPRNTLTSMKAIEELLFPFSGTSSILPALRNSGTKQVSLWWADGGDDKRRVWIGNHCWVNDLRSERLPHPIIFGFSICSSLLEETLSLIIKGLAASGFSLAVHIIYEPNFTAGTLDAINYPAIDTLYFYREDCLNIALPYLTLLEAGNGPAAFPNLSSLVAHYRLDTIRKSNMRAHFSGLLALYKARRSNVDGSHPFSMRMLDYLFNPKTRRFERERTSWDTDPGNPSLCS